jgi:hypothetical protein
MHYEKGAQTAVIHLSDWEEARQIGKFMSRWLFRGQARAEWALESSLERAFGARGISIQRTDPIEEVMLIEFKSAAHLFSTSVPKDEDTIAWLSLLRHHGGPTRLLDFTESFYVSAYFALEGATNDCSIWAFNRGDLLGRLDEVLDGLYRNLQISHSLSVEQKLDQILRAAIQGRITNNVVFTMSPSQRNERQFLQQALALVPLNLRKGFMGCLLGSVSPPASMPDEGRMMEGSVNDALQIVQKSKLVKLVLTKAAFLDARVDLEQMNINGATLFRGLDGLGKRVNDVLNTLESYQNMLKGRRTSG